MLRLLPAAFLAVLAATPAAAFEISFDWSGLRSCTSGNPNTVDNPAFKLKDVPPGTAFIRFRLKDLNAPGYDHGGGVVPYNGQAEIPRGAFRYRSPCPPGGVHTYEWTATAQSRRNGGAIAATAARRPYPE